MTGSALGNLSANTESTQLGQLLAAHGRTELTETDNLDSVGDLMALLTGVDEGIDSVFGDLVSWLSNPGDPQRRLAALCDRIVRGDGDATLMLHTLAAGDRLPEADLVLRNGLEPDGSVSAGRGEGEREDGRGAGAAE